MLKEFVRVGQGFDVHALVKGRKLVLGGVTIPFERDSRGTPTPMSRSTRCATRSSELRRSATSAGIFRTAIRNTRTPTAAPSCAKVGAKYATPDSRSPTSTPPSSPRREDGPAHPTMVANLAADRRDPRRPGSTQGEDAERLGAIGRGERIAAEAIALLVCGTDHGFHRCFGAETVVCPRF